MSGPPGSGCRVGPAGCRSGDGAALGVDPVHQVGPVRAERAGTLALERPRQCAHVDSRVCELGQRRFSVPTVGGHGSAEVAVVEERLEGLVRHRVDREGGGKTVDVERVGRLGVLGGGAGPEQPLHPCAGVLEALKAVGDHHLAVGAVGVETHRERQLVLQGCRCTIHHRLVPARHEHRRHRSDGRVEPALDPSLQTSEVGVSSRPVVVRREQQRDVDGDPRGDALLDRWQPFPRARDLDEQIRTIGPAVERCRRVHRAGGVAGK